MQETPQYAAKKDPRFDRLNVLPALAWDHEQTTLRIHLRWELNPITLLKLRRDYDVALGLDVDLKILQICWMCW